MFGDPTEIRTPATAVKGRCLSHLTIGPLAADARVELASERVKAVCVYHFTNPQYRRWFFALPQISMPCSYRFSHCHTGSTTINTSALCRLYSDTEKHAGDFIFPCCSSPQEYLGVWLPIGWDKQN